jgi:hypothetical protein
MDFMDSQLLNFMRSDFIDIWEKGAKSIAPKTEEIWSRKNYIEDILLGLSNQGR